MSINPLSDLLNMELKAALVTIVIDYKIAEAYIKEALDWQTIKPEDGTALQPFSLFLTGCWNTMTDKLHGRLGQHS